MGDTLADIVRHDRARQANLKLVARHTIECTPHRVKLSIQDLDFLYGTTRARRRVCPAPPHTRNCITGQLG